MKAKILSTLIGLVLRTLTPELLKEFADKVLDWVEDAVERSENKLDDATVLPLCNMIRSAFDIPDNDDQ
jgi:hypothetical protein